MLFDKVLSSFIREVYEVRKSRLYLSVVLILPLAMLAFFAMVFYKGTIEELPITVVDHDNTPMSRQLCLMIDATALQQIMAVPYSLTVPKAAEPGSP